jgi:hypothetical protein
MISVRGYVLKLAGIAVLAGMLGSGCATSRGELDIQLSEPANPASGTTVAITRVTDSRVFEEDPRQPSIPSLKYAKDIKDPAITSRAIARKRNGWGLAMGDILLPEGRTVEDLVKEALTRSFREAGYRVVEAPAAAGEPVVPVEADIEQFWAWFTPGVLRATLEFEARVNIKGDLPPISTGETVRGDIKLHAAVAGTRQWRNTITKGIESFIEAVKARLTE